jgi:hypothetical protein
MKVSSVLPTLIFFTLVAVIRPAVAEEPEPCGLVSEHVSFCGEDLEWRLVDNGQSTANANYWNASQTFASITVQDAGQTQGLSINSMSNFIVESMRDYNGGVWAPLLDQSVDRIDGLTGRTVVLSPTKEGVTAVYAITIVVTRDNTLILKTFVVANDYTAEHQTLHADFLSRLRLDYPNG